jgi:hypothetical protein
MDNSPDAAQAAVMAKFPEFAARIREGFRQNHSFQSLCEDYWDCLRALQHWQQATSEDAPEIYQSYLELRRELEQEIQQYLQPPSRNGANPGLG